MELTDFTYGKNYEAGSKIIFRDEEYVMMDNLDLDDLIRNATKNYFDSCGKRRTSNYISGIKKVIYNDPATTVIWHDGSKTTVKCHDEDTYDPVIGFLLCIIKKVSDGRGYSALCKPLDDAYLRKNSIAMETREKERNERIEKRRMLADDIAYLHHRIIFED